MIFLINTGASMRRFFVLVGLAILIYLLLNALVPWKCEVADPLLRAETNTGAYIYTLFSTEKGPSGKRSYYGGYSATILKVCTRWSSVIYEVTMGEGYGAFQTWISDSDLTLENR
jgi:hypothetical protein